MVFGKIIILIANTFGCGPQPDSFRYHDNFRVNTLGHFGDEAGGIRIPNLTQLGLAHLTYIKGTEKPEIPWGYYGKIRSRSDEKSIASGYFEMSGINLQKPFRIIEEEIPENISNEISQFLDMEINPVHIQNLSVLKNNLGDAYFEKSTPVIFAEKNESTFEIIIHVNDMEKLQIKESQLQKFFKNLIQKEKISQASIHFLTGTRETHHLIPEKRRDVFFEITDQNTIFQTLEKKRIPVYSYGNTGKIYNYSGFSEDYHIPDPLEMLEMLANDIKLSETDPDGRAVFVADMLQMDLCHQYSDNIYDFIRLLEKFDSYLPRIFRNLRENDWVFIHGIHGCDTLNEKSHTREYAPLLVYNNTQRNIQKKNLGVRKTFSDIAESISEAYQLETHYGGEAFWNQMGKNN